MTLAAVEYRVPTTADSGAETRGKKTKKLHERDFIRPTKGLGDGAEASPAASCPPTLAFRFHYSSVSVQFS